MNIQPTKSKVISSLFWKFMESGGTQGIQFLVQIVLARLLLPEDFGTVAIVMVFITLARVFIESGLNTALIQKKNADDLDFSSVFYLSLLLSAVLYIIVSWFSPFIASVYQEPELVPILRVLSTSLFLGAINSIQKAYIAKKMLFKKLFFSSLYSILFSGVLGIAAAFAGLGVWALVVQQLTNQLLITITLWFTVKWRPQLVFSRGRLKELMSFGWKLLFASLSNAIYLELRTLIIGAIYTPALLGYYSRGEQFPKVIANHLDGPIQSVLFPTLSAQQDNKNRVKEMVRRAIVSSSFLVFPTMIGLAAVAEPLVVLVLTEKWLPSVPFLRIFCLSYALRPMHTANLQAIKALGKSDIFLRLTLVKNMIGLIVLIISIPYGMYAIAFGTVITGLSSSLIYAYPNKKLIGYTYIDQWRDIGPSLLISLVMGIGVHVLGLASLPIWQVLTLQIFSGITLYILLARLFRVESYNYLLQTMKDVIRTTRRKGKPLEG